MSEQALWAAPTALSLSSTGRLGLMSVDDKQHRKQVVGERCSSFSPEFVFTVNNTQAESPLSLRGGSGVGSADSTARITVEQSRRSASLNLVPTPVGHTATQECTITTSTK